MRIALINEISQASKNTMIEHALRKTVEPLGHTVINYGMYSAEDNCPITYVQVGILAALLLNAKAADYVVTGCGTGEGAMLACNCFPGVICGHIADPLDAFTFAQINDGNAVSLPFAKGFGWGADLNLTYIFEKLFQGESGQGYPPERVQSQAENRKLLDHVKKISCRRFVDILPALDQTLVRGALSGSQFQTHFFRDCQDKTLAALTEKILNSSK